MALSHSIPGVSAAAAADIRRKIYCRGAPLTPADMELVFQTARQAGPAPSPEWIQLFSEAVSDYVVHQNDPPDEIPQAKSDWLAAMLKKGGGITTPSEFAMLIDVMNAARDVPPSLSAFALQEIASAVMSGRRDAFGGGDGRPAGAVSRADVEALRSVLYAATAGSPSPITREEAEALFALAHATAGKASDPSFDDLFARAVGNYLMAAALGPAAQKDALQRELWLEDGEHLAGFFSRLAAGRDSERFLAALNAPLEAAENKFAARFAFNQAATAAKAESDAAWAIAHLTREGSLSSAEMRLLKWLAAEANALPPALRALAEVAERRISAPPKLRIAK
jgi:hypothetical protein